MIAYDFKTRTIVELVEAEEGVSPRYLPWRAMSARQRLAALDNMLPRTQATADYINRSTTTCIRELKRTICRMSDGKEPLDAGALKALLADCERERVERGL